MGALTSREAQNIHNVDPGSSSIYRFPPKNGAHYFGTHFLMGGERFESSPPEAFLFGDNSDLSFLGGKPVQFPYPQPQGTEPTRSLQCLINLRRDSIKFAKVASAVVADSTADEPTDAEPDAACPYNISFTFDCDVPCSISIHYFATQINDPSNLKFVSSMPQLSSPSYRYDTGAGQIFSQTDHIFDPSLYPPNTLCYNAETEVIPVVIVIKTQVHDRHIAKQTQVTYANVQQSAEGQGFVLKPLKQKLMVDGVTLLLQEMYGIENKNVPHGQPKGADWDENGADCVVCMSELRDTLIVPCRHLCLCNACAETLRYKANNCPICRSPFRALLQMKTMRKLKNTSSTPNLNYAEDGEPVVTLNTITSRYEPVALIEALNGPVDHTHTCVSHMPTCSSAPILAGGMCAPRPPPRAKLKKKTTKPAAQIQQVLTPQAIPSHAVVQPKTKYYLGPSKSSIQNKIKMREKVDCVDRTDPLREPAHLRKEDETRERHEKFEGDSPRAECSMEEMNSKFEIEDEEYSETFEKDEKSGPGYESVDCSTPKSSMSATSISSSKPLLTCSHSLNALDVERDSSHD